MDLLRANLQPATCEDQDRPESLTGESQQGHGVLHPIIEAEKLAGLIVATLVLTEQAVVAHFQRPPRLDVDHDDAPRTNQQEVDVRALRPGPPAVGEDAPPERLQCRELRADRRLGALRQVVPSCALMRLAGQTLVCLSLKTRTTRFVVRGRARSHLFPRILACPRE